MLPLHFENHKTTKYMKKLLLLTLLSAVMVNNTLRADDITVDNTKRNYLVYVPQNLGEKRPLLISCHGMNQDAAYQKGMLQIESVADTAKFVTVFPNGINKGWDLSGDRDIHFVEALINEMVTRYDIDPNRVYLSGFSMGGMFTYFAMNRIADKIAAFAPISGYPMYGGNYTSSRPVPIIHTHGTSDDVVNYGGVQSVLDGWVRRNGCPTTPVVTSRYRNTPNITRYVWGPGENGVEVVLMELAGKGHWISNDYGVLTGDEIWKFCKRYSLELKNPVVRITSPANSLSFVTLGGPSETPAVTVSATATDPDGQVASVAFYDGNTLLAEQTEAPFQCTVEGQKKGQHTIRVVATDDEGNQGYAQTFINVEEPTTNYVFTNIFATENSVPEGWTTYDGNEQRIGFVSGFSSGSRVFHFTGDKHDFEWGLYTRNVTGAPKAGYARYAAKESTTTLMLHPANYQVYNRISNWNQPNFSPVTIAIESIDGTTIYSETFTPTSNIGNAASNSFEGTTLRNFTFDVTEKGLYVISFYTADAGWADLVVGQASIRKNGNLSAISSVTADAQLSDGRCYNLAGQLVDGRSLRKGIYIYNGKKVKK